MKKILLFFLILNLIWSIALYLEPTHVTAFNYLYNLSYGLNFLLATYISFSFMKTCRIHHPIHIVMGLGSLSFFIAQLIWVYYNLILFAEVPYPGLADLFWMLFYPFTAIGGVLVMKEIKINFTWDRILEILLTFAIVFSIIFSFISVNKIQEQLSPLTQLLNLSYPFFDALLLTLTLTAIRSQLGKLQPVLLYFMFAFVALAFGDTLFAYQTTLGYYWNGNIIDAIYAFAGYLYTLGILSLPQIIHPEENSPQMLGTLSRV